MSSLVDDSTAQIARRLRFEREARGWSLADLAARSEVSKATISKIEREKASPTAVILVRLAGAFDLTLAGLLLRAESERQRVSRTAEQQCWRDPETGYSRRQVFSQPDHPVEVVEVSLPPGQKVILPASSYARIRQAVWVLSGDLVIAEGRERHQLATGDCLGFGAPSEVTFVNEAATPCAYLVVLARN
jgi:transcriptional regulator with XRE-family HTH domain